MIQGYDSLQLRSPEQDLEPFHTSLEIQFSNPNWLTIRTKTELEDAKSMRQMGHFYYRTLFSYRKKSSDYQIMPFHTSYDMFTISYPTAASCHSQHALNNTWPKPNLPFTLQLATFSHPCLPWLSCFWHWWLLIPCFWNCSTRLPWHRLSFCLSARSSLLSSFSIFWVLLLAL